MESSLLICICEMILSINEDKKNILIYIDKILFIFICEFGNFYK